MRPRSNARPASALHLHPDPQLRLSVAIPARNEAPRVAACLQAFAEQRDLAGQPLDRRGYEIVLLANNCTDDTAERARAEAARHPGLAVRVIEAVYEDDRAHVGTARRAAMEFAAARLERVGHAHTVIATTDADSCVDARWVAATLQAVAAGADVVAGRAFADADERAALPPASRRTYLEYVAYRELAAALEARLDPHPGDPAPRHSQHHGASLAVTLDAYRAVGGLPPERGLEDLALHRALLLSGYRVRHDPEVRVTTSARVGYRTPFGLAHKLQQWADETPLFVGSPASLVYRLQLRRGLRCLWHLAQAGPSPLPEVDALAGVLHLDAAWLRVLLAAPRPFEQVLDAVEREQSRRTDGREAWPLLVVGRTVRESSEGWSPRWPLVPVGDAVRELRQRIYGTLSRPLAPLREVQPVFRRAS